MISLLLPKCRQSHYYFANLIANKTIQLSMTERWVAEVIGDDYEFEKITDDKMNLRDDKY